MLLDYLLGFQPGRPRIGNAFPRWGELVFGLRFLELLVCEETLLPIDPKFY